MSPKSQFPADLVTFTGEILDGNLHFLCSVRKISKSIRVFVSGILYTYNSNHKISNKRKYIYSGSNKIAAVTNA